MSTAQDQGQVFIRRSSGLTRQISALDALMYCAMNPGLLFSMVYILWAPYLFPGAHMGTAVLWVATMFPVAGLYWLFSVSMPRSGGEYLYVSRVLHPSLGLMSSFVLSITAISWCGILTDWWIMWALSDYFYTIGLLNGNASMTAISEFLRGPWVRTIIGTLSILLTGWVFMKGAKLMMKISWWAVGFSTLGVVVWLLGGALYGGNFAANWTALTGVDYNAIPAAAEAGGFTLKFTFMATLMGGVTYVVLNTLGATFSANMAGEIRGVQKSQMLALFGALVIQMVLWFGFYQGSYWIQGSEWTNALMWAYNEGAEVYPFPAEPFATIMIGIITKSPVFVFLLAVSFFVATWASAAGLAYGPTRNIFAWAFDRLLPASFSEISRKYRAPMTTIWVTMFVSWLFLLMNIWTPSWTANIAYTISAWFVSWIILGIAGMLFPYVKKDLFEASPPVVRSRFLGIPVVSILGFLTLAVSLFIEYSMLQPYFTGSLPYTFLVMTLIFMIIPIIIYVAAKAYHSGKGVPLEAQFAQIPPE